MKISGGRLLGQFCNVVLFGIMLLACVVTFVAHQWPSPDLMPSHERQLQSYNYAGNLEEASEVGQALVWIQPVAALGVIVFSCCFIAIMSVLYHSLYIKGSADLYLPQNVVVPQDLKGKWAYDKFDCSSACGTFCCHCWCGPFVIAETWYRAGWVHAVLGPNANREVKCPGWQYFAGLGGYFATEYFAGCCLVCLFGVLRGGLRFIDGGNGGVGEIEDHRTRFGLPHEGWSTFCEDCCCWCWCGACVGTQEYRQVMALLNRQPLQVAPPSGVQVVGAPVAVGTPYEGPTATVVSANNVKEGTPGWQG